MDYTIFYKQNLPVDHEWPPDNQWDIFISAHNLSERYNKVFEKVRANDKYWLVFEEYGYCCISSPGENYYHFSGNNEATYIKEFFRHYKIDLCNKRICIDMTGFIRPHLMFLIKYLHYNNITKFDALYSEPDHYIDKEETVFTQVVRDVDPVKGFQGIYQPDTSNDLLIIGAGYDNELIAHVANKKNSASKKKLNIWLTFSASRFLSRKYSKSSQS